MLPGPCNQISSFTESHSAGKCGCGKWDITDAIWKNLLSKAIKAKSKNEVGEISGLLPASSEEQGGWWRSVQQLQGAGSSQMEME